jgi:uncharacterized protein (PEP-CTERM system associated)
VVLAALFLGFPAAAQVESSAPSVPSPIGTPPAPGGVGLPGAAGSWGPFAPGAPGVPLAPDSAARAGAAGFPFALVGPTPAGQPARAWTITPSLGISETYNDNIRFTSRNKQADWITTVNAGLAAAVDTARLQGVLNYLAGYNFYANTDNQSGLTLNGNGQFLFTVIPDHFFVSTRGSANTQPFGSAVNPQSQTRTGTGNLVRSYSFLVSPYGLYRFGGTATAFAGYVFQYVDQSAVNTRSVPQQATTIEELLLRQARSVATSYSSHQLYTGARTGEDFGRLAMQGTISGTWFEGGGLYEGAYRNLALLETRYAFLPTIAGLVELGYERERFNTIPKTDIDGPVWAVGARLTPNPDSLIVVKYGRRDGFNSWRLNANWAVGVRTTVFATYQETLTTSALNTGDLLSTTVLDPLGNPVDAQTGAPVLPGIANQLLGAPGVLFRQKLGTAGISQTWSRDTFSLTLTYLDSVPFATTADAVRRRVSIETTSIGVSWTRSLTPITSMSAFASYAMNTTTFDDVPVQRGGNDFNTVNAGVTLVTALSPTVGAALSYQINWRDNAVGGGAGFDSGSAIQNIFTAGLRKSF